MKLLISIFLLCTPLALKAQKQHNNILLKGTNTSMINLYGPKQLLSVPITQTPTKQLKTYSSKGFKILVYFGKDRQKATHTKTQAAQYFGLNTSITYDAPNYYVKTGEFTTREEAEVYLSKILEKYPDAVVVPDIITIRED